MKFNRTEIFNGFRTFLSKRGKQLSQARVNAIEFLISSFEADPRWNDMRFIAYALATISIETAWTFEPIQEYGSYAYFERRYGVGTRVGARLGNDAIGEGSKYSGKGYVQLTGESNYERLETKIRNSYPHIVQDFQRQTGKTFDLTEYAEQAKNPRFAFLIMTIGMFEGLFTGKKFSDYFTDLKSDWVNARRIINGTDRANEIGVYAVEIFKILQLSKTNAIGIPVTTNVSLPKSDNGQVNGFEDVLELEPSNGFDFEEKPLETVPDAQGASVSVEVADGNIKVEQKDAGSSGQKEKIAIEKPERQGFIQAMRNRIAGLTGGNIGLDFLQEKLSQIQALGLSAGFWTKVTYFAIGGSILYLLFFVYKYYSDNKKNEAITNKLIEANSTENNFVQLISKEQVEEFKQKGYKVITR